MAKGKGKRMDLKPVSIDGIEFDALMDESQEYTATVPAYNVENGYPISDGIIINPFTLTMELYLTPTPVTWLSEHGHSPKRVRQVIKKLEDMWEQKKLVTIVTTNAKYKNMAITSLTIAHSTDDKYARTISVEAQKVTKTARKTTKVPSNLLKSGTTSASAGTADTTDTSDTDSTDTGTSTESTVSDALEALGFSSSKSLLASGVDTVKEKYNSWKSSSSSSSSSNN